MNLPTETAAKIQEMENKLSALDSLFRKFCERNGYTVGSYKGVWPRLRSWRRTEIDRTFDLTMDLSVPEFHLGGFSPEMPWSLHVTASTLSIRERSVVTVAVFRGTAFSMLSEILPQSLESGLHAINAITADMIIARGKAIG